MFTREYLLRPIKQTPTEMRAGVEYVSTPLLSNRRAPRAAIWLASFQPADNIRNPMSRPAQVNPQLIVSSSVT